MVNTPGGKPGHSNNSFLGSANDSRRLEERVEQEQIAEEQREQEQDKLFHEQAEQEVEAFLGNAGLQKYESKTPQRITINTVKNAVTERKQLEERIIVIDRNIPAKYAGIRNGINLAVCCGMASAGTTAVTILSLEGGPIYGIATGATLVLTYSLLFGDGLIQFITEKMKKEELTKNRTPIQERQLELEEILQRCRTVTAPGDYICTGKGNIQYVHQVFPDSIQTYTSPLSKCHGNISSIWNETVEKKDIACVFTTTNMPVEEAFSQSLSVGTPIVFETEENMRMGHIGRADEKQYELFKDWNCGYHEATIKAGDKGTIHVLNVRQ